MRDRAAWRRWLRPAILTYAIVMAAPAVGESPWGAAGGHGEPVPPILQGQRPPPPAPPEHSPAPQPPAPPPAAPPAETEAKPPPLNLETIAADNAAGALGKKVHGPKGENMGLVVDILVDNDGHPLGAVIDFGGFLGVGSRKIAIAWSLLHDWRGGHDTPVQLSLSRAQLQAAPEYKPNAQGVQMVGIPPAEDRTTPEGQAPPPETRGDGSAPPPGDGAAPPAAKPSSSSEPEPDAAPAAPVSGAPADPK